LAFKEKTVKDNLERIAKVPLSAISPIVGSDSIQFYRNKMDYTFSNKRWLTKEEVASDLKIEEPALGFHVPKRFDKIIEIDKCFLQDDRANDIRNETAKFTKANGYDYYDIRQNTGLMRNLIIRNTSTNEWMVIVVFAADEKEKIAALLSHLKNTFPFITSLLYVINTKKNDTIFDLEILTYHGADFISESMQDLKGKEISFRISPKAFYQTNSAQAAKLYQLATQMAELTGEEVVYDLYTGTGTIANFIASSAKKVIGIEYVADAIKDAVINSEINGIDNTLFFAGDMKEVLTTEFIATHGKPQVVITDPPRAGMHEDVCKKLLFMRSEKIVYISCNPATQARDIAILDEAYEVTKIQPVDMFPHTEHVENIVLLTLKK
jgi:23S rRNA (uracil1939-C5)-methyltransferase